MSNNELSADELAERYMAGSNKAEDCFESFHEDDVYHPETVAGFLKQVLFHIYGRHGAHESANGLLAARDLINRADNDALNSLSHFAEWEKDMEEGDD